MKHIFHTPLLLLICIAFSSCNVLQALQLKDCKYAYSHISDVTFMNMSAKDRTNLLGTTQIARALVGKADNLPLGCTIHVNVSNPNKQTASMERVFYSIDIDSIQVAEGSTTDKFIILGESTTDLPIQIVVNLKTLIQEHSQATIANLLKNFLGISDTPSHITVKLRPVIEIAGHPTTLAAPIPLSFDFGGNKEEIALPE